MNWDVVEGKWDQFKGNAKEKWGDLTDDEVTEMEGKRDKVIGKLQEKYGWTKEKAEEEADAFLSEHA
ncbi:CsbD family protein [Donghicola sp. XS_ASV15]|uniref:CsbD family protein n=1 Tax=Donghicola sp. XS_ASV15 TaxID=3241295 RepID=UPI003517E953